MQKEKEKHFVFSGFGFDETNVLCPFGNCKLLHENLRKKACHIYGKFTMRLWFSEGGKGKIRVLYVCETIWKEAIKSVSALVELFLFTPYPQAGSKKISATIFDVGLHDLSEVFSSVGRKQS